METRSFSIIQMTTGRNTNMSGRKAGLMTQNPIGMNVCPDMEPVILPIIPKKAAIRSISSEMVR